MNVVVDIIIPVHNASKTIEDAVISALEQYFPRQLLTDEYTITVTVCCYDDGSTDDSFTILKRLKEDHSRSKKRQVTKMKIPCNLLIASSAGSKGRGAGYARNKAIQLHEVESSDVPSDTLRFLCLLDSDDTMHKHRIAEQTHYMLKSVEPEMRHRTLLGCTFVRDPPDSTWHYSRWANSLSDERLMLERFREVTILQPTWFLCRSRWSELGGYVEAPLTGTAAELIEQEESVNKRCRLIHSEHDDQDSLCLAEDLRFFHEHLWSDGTLQLHRGKNPLVTYRHVMGQSQSYRTSRKLLLQLRVLAFERSVLETDRWRQDGGQFIVWGAGRDGKEFVKTLCPEMRKRVYCFVDVDSKKLESGSYMNRELNLNIPIIHFSYLVDDIHVRKKIQKEWEDESVNDEVKGCIDKTKKDDSIPTLEPIKFPESKRRRIAKIPELDLSKMSQSKLERLPVVVCVAMYRTNGVLERNVKTINRTEGIDLWHFS
jgi:glycosyltransferase involved in cell wall biosynthesis